ncbi:MAG TPA: phosphatase PAP2 family protein [Bacteroidia bacterium]|nr:phosphatase PAP2 family protein [Bacteroidia bacterium]
MVTYATLVYFYALSFYFQVKPVIVGVIVTLIFTGTFLLPAVAAVLILRIGRIRSLEMTEKQERNWPLVQTAIIYSACYYVFDSEIFQPFIRVFILGALFGMVAALFINLFRKISLHMIGTGGLCGGVAGLMISGEVGSSSLLLAACFILAGLVGTSRLQLGAHNPRELFAGFFVGFGVEFLVMVFLL